MSPRRSSNGFIKECIVTALVDLMKDKDFQHITITEITQKAGVSRMAYYRYYSSKNDILNQYMEDVTSSVRDVARVSSDENKMRTYFREMFEQLGKHNDLCVAVIKANLGELLLNNISKHMFRTFGRDDMTVRQNYELHLVIGGFSNLFIQWLINDRRESSDEMAQICCEIMSYNGFVNTVM